MQEIYGYTIFANYTLVAISMAIYVFAASIYRGALDVSTKETEKTQQIRKINCEPKVRRN